MHRFEHTCQKPCAVSDGMLKLRTARSCDHTCLGLERECCALMAMRDAAVKLASESARCLWQHP